MLNVTDLSTYKYCPRKLFLKKVLGLRGPLNAAMVLGRVRHDALDRFSKSERDIVTRLESDKFTAVFGEYRQKASDILRQSIIMNKSDLKEFNVDLAKAFRDTWDSLLDEAEERAHNTSKFMKETELKGEELWDALTPKIKSEEWIASLDLGLRGKMDKVKFYEDEAVVHDIKTGRAPDEGVWPGDKIQVGAYMTLLKDQGRDVKKGFVNYLGVGEREIPFNPFVEEKVKDLRDEILETLEGDLPQRIDNDAKCAACSLREKCYDDTFMKKQMDQLTR